MWCCIISSSSSAAAAAAATAAATAAAAAATAAAAAAAARRARWPAALPAYSGARALPNQPQGTSPSAVLPEDEGRGDSTEKGDTKGDRDKNRRINRHKDNETKTKGDTCNIKKNHASIHTP